jgi:chromosome segregation ATPase
MTTPDITGHVLADIRDEIRGTNTRLDQAITHLGARLDQAVTRLDTRIDAHERILLRIADQLGRMDARLDRIDEGQQRTDRRLETIVGLLTTAATRHETIDEAIADLQRRVGVLEQRDP